MKNFLSKNWKRIIYLVAIIFIIFNFISTLLTKNTIIDDFYKYGPDYKRPDIVIQIDEKEIVSGESTITKSISDNTGMPDNLARGVLILAGGILIIMVISNIIEGNSASSAKKK